MVHDKFRELPLEAKNKMATDIAKIIRNLNNGILDKADIRDLKARSVHLSEEIQQDVLMFIEQVEFQHAYDPWHRVTKEVTKAADRLVRHMGLSHYLRAS